MDGDRPDALRRLHSPRDAIAGGDARQRRSAGSLAFDALARSFARTATRRGLLAATAGTAFAALGRRPDRVALAKPHRPSGPTLSREDKRCRELDQLKQDASKLVSAANRKVETLQTEAPKIQRNIDNVTYWLNSTPPSDPLYQGYQKQLANLQNDLAKNQNDQTFFQEQADVYQQQYDAYQKEFSALNCYCRLRVERAGDRRQSSARDRPLCCAGGARPIGKRCRGGCASCGPDETCCQGKCWPAFYHCLGCGPNSNYEVPEFSCRFSGGDRCVNGECRCGDGPACDCPGQGQVCRNGQCECAALPGEQYCSVEVAPGVLKLGQCAGYSIPLDQACPKTPGDEQPQFQLCVSAA